MPARILPLSALAALVMVGAAQAEQFVTRGEADPGITSLADLPKRSCYHVSYIPATYRVNTRGKLIRPESVSWEGDLAEGSVIVRRRVPATYLETRRLIEPDHYSLRRIACRD